MAYVINEPCIGTKDTSCVEVCPVDCIHPTPEEPSYEQHGQLYAAISSGARAPVAAYGGAAGRGGSCGDQ